MGTTFVRLTPLLALAMLFGACDSDPTGTGQTSFMQATVQSVPTTVAGSVTIEHRGRAEWVGGTGTTQQHLTVRSGDVKGRGSIMLSRLTSEPGSGFFQVGEYALVPRNFQAGDNDGYTARYVPTETRSYYIAESGTLTITDVDPDAKIVAGHFDLIVAYWCNPHTSRDRCLQSPKDVGFTSDAERLQIRGEFRAEPLGPIVVF